MYAHRMHEGTGEGRETHYEMNSGPRAVPLQSAERNIVKRTTNGTTKRTTIGRIAVGVALAAALVPGAAFAAGDFHALSGAGLGETGATASSGTTEIAQAVASRAQSLNQGSVESITFDSQSALVPGESSLQAGAFASEKVLAYDPALIEAIGTQESTGHTICCPSFSCAYADAVMDATVHDHEYYTCSCCTWVDWGGGDSSYRYVGSDEELLCEAYDQITAGRPTVIHVAASYGEHWIALIGYTGVDDPANLTLDNFVALDPWDGAQIIASERFDLYGDGCEHVSER